MSNPSEPSAGTARPDAAPSDPIQSDQIVLVLRALAELYPVEAPSLYHAAGYVVSLLSDARERDAIMRAERTQWEELEARLCPEDFGFEETITALRSRLAEREAECERLRTDAERLDWLALNFRRVDVSDRAHDKRWSVYFGKISGKNVEPVYYYGATLGEAIDAARELSTAVAPAALEPNTGGTTE